MKIFNLPNPNTVSRTEAKSNARSEVSFFQIASESFRAASLSQTIVVPGSYNDAAAGFLKTKTEIELGSPEAEDSIEDKVDSLISRIGALLNKSK